ncbi:RHS repeat-associated protein [Arthrobacter sp. CAN_A6]|uniref:RHS repeat-associated core domain-containing protein n=1 Tax=Arthrobacter sp. CAN_A6 TaxID=2787721 RepID=UPI0018CA93D5
MITRANTAGGGTITYGYDRASNLTSVSDTRGTTTYTFDTSGAPTSMTYGPTGAQKTVNFATDDRGRRTDTWLDSDPSNTTWAAHTRNSYDTTGRITRVLAEQQNEFGTFPVVDLSYCYNAGTTGTCATTTASDRTKIQRVTDNISGAVTAYTYDQAGRLTNAVITGGEAPATYTYTYDSRGNRLTASGGTQPNQSFTANPANQISTAGYTYDGTGNLTASPEGTQTYNGAGQMKTATREGTAYTYTYAGTTQNELLAQTTPDGNYSYNYGRTDAQGLPVIEQLKRGNGTAYIEHDPVTGEPLVLRTAAGRDALYIYDGTGNPAALITSEPYVAFAYTYDPYGVPTLTGASGGAAVLQNPYLFKAGTQDRTTGWVKYGARWYNPTTGRWTQQDTLDTPLDPANANRYAFAANDPINNSDPLGLYTFGEGASDCATGAASSVAISLGLGTIGGPGALVGGLVGGCTVSIISGIAADFLTDNQQDEDRVSNGLDYIGFLGDAARVAGRLL